MTKHPSRYAFAGLCALALSAAAPLAARAAEGPGMMNYIVVTVKPQTEAAYLKWVQGHVMPMTMAQPGYKGGGLFKDAMVPNTYVVVGQWESRAAMEAWMKAEHQLVLHADQSLIDPLRGAVHEEPHLFETKAVPFKP